MSSICLCALKLYLSFPLARPQEEKLSWTANELNESLSQKKKKLETEMLAVG